MVRRYTHDACAGAFSWHRNNKRYARRTNYTTGFRRTIYLHREICGAKEGEEVDHINDDILDCRRENLRVASNAVNEYNKPAAKRSTNGLRGVYERNGRYRAIVANESLGTHDTVRRPTRTS